MWTAGAFQTKNGESIGRHVQNLHGASRLLHVARRSGAGPYNERAAQLPEAERETPSASLVSLTPAAFAREAMGTSAHWWTLPPWRKRRRKAGVGWRRSSNESLYELPRP